MKYGGDIEALARFAGEHAGILAEIRGAAQRMVTHADELLAPVQVDGAQLPLVSALATRGRTPGFEAHAERGARLVAALGNDAAALQAARAGLPSPTGYMEYMLYFPDERESSIVHSTYGRLMDGAHVAGDAQRLATRRGAIATYLRGEGPPLDEIEAERFRYDIGSLHKQGERAASASLDNAVGRIRGLRAEAAAAAARAEAAAADRAARAAGRVSIAEQLADARDLRIAANAVEDAARARAHGADDARAGIRTLMGLLGSLSAAGGTGRMAGLEDQAFQLVEALAAHDHAVRRLAMSADDLRVMSPSPLAVLRGEIFDLGLDDSRDMLRRAAAVAGDEAALEDWSVLVRDRTAALRASMLSGIDELDLAPASRAQVYDALDRALDVQVPEAVSSTRIGTQAFETLRDRLLKGYSLSGQEVARSIGAQLDGWADAPTTGIAMTVSARIDDAALVTQRLMDDLVEKDAPWLALGRRFEASMGDAARNSQLDARAAAAGALEARAAAGDAVALAGTRLLDGGTR